MVKIPYFFLVNKDGYEKSKNITEQFELASLSKSFTALAIVILVVQDKLKLYDKISDFFPEFKFMYRGKEYDVSVLQVLQHTAGISRKTLCFQHEGMDDIYETAKAIALFPLSYVPGYKYEYATGAYVILGAIIEKVSGKSYSDFMENVIFKMLSMNNTNARGKTLVGTKKIFGIIKNKKWQGCCAFSPCGYIVSDIEDMKIWLEAFCNTDKVVESDIKKAVSIIKNIEYYVKTKEKKVLYGFGWFYNIETGKYYHDGRNPMFSTYMEYSNQNIEYVIVAVANAEISAKKMFGAINRHNRESVEKFIQYEISKKNIGISVKLILESIFSAILFFFDWKYIFVLLGSLFIYAILRKIRNLSWREILMWFSIDQLINIYLYVVILVYMLCFIFKFIFST